MKQQRLYFDNNATTAIHPVSKKAMIAAMNEIGNPSSIHHSGRTAKNCLEEARETIAACINCDRDQIIFTSGATESNNQVLKAFQDLHNNGHIITSPTEHSSIRKTADALKENGSKVTFLPVDEAGKIDLEELRKQSINKSTLLSLMFANNETGTLQPLEEALDIAKREGAIVHSDAVQGFGKKNIDVQALNLDLASASAHKFYGPKGIGFLYVKDDHVLTPLLHGGTHERKLRAGTENLVGAVGMAAALKWVCDERDALVDHYQKLRSFCWDGLQTIGGAKLNGHETDHIGNTVNVSFEGVDGQALLMNLDLAGIEVSTGSACSSGSIVPSPVLLAMGLSKPRVKSALRLSFGHQNTVEEIEQLVQTLSQLVPKLRSS